MNEKRVLVIDSCLGCPKYRYEGEGDEWCDRVFQQMKGRPGGEVWPDCPLPRREPWLKLKEAAEAILESPVEHEGPRLSYKLMQVEQYKLDDLRSALEAVKEKQNG